MDTTVLLITPPFTQLNTPYPATAYLKGYLNTIRVKSFQVDLGIETILDLFSEAGLKSIFSEAESLVTAKSGNSKRIFLLQEDYIETIDLVIDFLQGNNPSLAHLICDGNLLPEASRFEAAEDLEWAFGTMGIMDKAKHLATLYLEDISDFIVDVIDPHFGFSRYAERLARSANSFNELETSLNQPESLIDRSLLKILRQKMEGFQPQLVGISVPFPGNLYGGLKCGQWLRKFYPDIKVVMGGGFVNTELRSVSDPRVFDYVDFITLDDGEAPLSHLIQYIQGERSINKLKRTFVCMDGKVVYLNGSEEKDIAQRDSGTPEYGGLLLNKYISVIEVTNPMHRLWSDGRWNKLTLAHGCYWGRCTFCDTTLDYIKRFEPNTIHILCDRISQIVSQTLQTGFHFVDEAAPPALLKALSLELIRRRIKISWWANIRFEKNFTSDLCKLLKEAGCIAVSGGLEVASDKILRLINKGVSVTQVAQVCDNFTQAGIMVHAYLMYGFPTQTEQETIDSLEVVRQLFQNGLVQSGFWHQFALTAHSPIGQNPDPFNISIQNPLPGTFANNDLEFVDHQGCEHEKFGDGLSKSLFNFMHGIGFDFSLQEWFDFSIPVTTIPPNYISKALKNTNEIVNPNSILLWLGNKPELLLPGKSKKGKPEIGKLVIHNKKQEIELPITPDVGAWFIDLFPRFSVKQDNPVSYSLLEETYTKKFEANFLDFWNGKTMKILREEGFIAV